MTSERPGQRPTDDTVARTPRVGIVVVNWNNYPDTAACLDGLRDLEYPEYDVVVVDNGSTDGSGGRLKAEYEWCEFVRNDRNLGFGGGCNAGIDRALSLGCEYVMILNNDAELRDGALGELVAVAEESGAGVVGAMVRDGSGDPVTSGPNRYPDMLFYSGYRENLPFGSSSRDARAGRRWWDTDRVEGAGALFPRAFLRERAESVGSYLDDSLFMYCEEVELSLWCRENGWSNVVAPNAVVVHEGGESSNRAFQLYYLTRNRLLVAHRYLPPSGRLLFDLLYLASRIALAGRYLKRGQRSTASAILRGLSDGFRRVDGKRETPT